MPGGGVKAGVCLAANARVNTQCLLRRRCVRSHSGPCGPLPSTSGFTCQGAVCLVAVAEQPVEKREMKFAVVAARK